MNTQNHIGNNKRLEQQSNLLISSDWLARFAQFNKLIVGFSGGLDSTVLLHALSAHLDLRFKLIAVHVNHGISPNAASWQNHCEQWCSQYGIALIRESVQFNRSANVEERARIARYAAFASLMTTDACLILGHHQDDQAETVLLQLFRGAGIDGLAAMTEWGNFSTGVLARPFLKCSRSQLERYAVQHQLTWIEDESNQDSSYSRNYLRRQIMPMLLEKWPGVVKTIARTAIHCQQAKNNLDALAEYDFSMSQTAEHEELRSNSLFIEPLLDLNIERLANILRVWLRNNQVQFPATPIFNRLIYEVIFARHDAVPEVSWGNNLIRRYQNRLFLDKKNEINLPTCTEWVEFPAPLTIETAEINLFAKEMRQGLSIPNGAKLVIKFRQGGEIFNWHGQSKQLKKLLQEWGVPPWLRDRVPLVYVDDQLAAVVGYAVSDLFFNPSAGWLLSASSCGGEGEEPL